MKKPIIIVLALLQLGSSSIQAQTISDYARNAKQSAVNAFNNSVDRMKRCIKGQCTKMEALKVARDLGIAASAAIATMYAAGAGIRRMAPKEKYPELKSLLWIPAIYHLEQNDALPQDAMNGDFIIRPSGELLVIRDLQNHTYVEKADEEDLKIFEAVQRYKRMTGAADVLQAPVRIPYNLMRKGVSHAKDVVSPFAAKGIIKGDTIIIKTSEDAPEMQQKLVSFNPFTRTVTVQDERDPENPTETYPLSAVDLEASSDINLQKILSRTFSSDK
jgi:hypothetical protein